MVRAGMRRYRVRTADQASLIADDGGRLDLAALFGAAGLVRCEIGFGHGEFISRMAASHPDERFIGVDYDALRATKTAHKSLKLDARNLRLFTDEAHRFVRFRLPPASLSHCYILFPDPWPKTGHRRRRLLNRSFLIDVTRAVAPGGRLVIASDTHGYAFQALSNLTTIASCGSLGGGPPRGAMCWRNLYAPNGYRVDIPTRFPTTFEVHKKAEGDTILYLLLERTDAPAPPPVPWRAREPGTA
jgi:tRNA (guanine-N(7)-)-methyltransferase